MGLTQTIVTMKKLTDRLGVKGQRQKCLKCNLSLTWLGVVDDVRSAHAGAGAHRRCRGALGLHMEPGAVLDKLQTLLSVTHHLEK